VSGAGMVAAGVARAARSARVIGGYYPGLHPHEGWPLSAVLSGVFGGAFLMSVMMVAASVAVYVRERWGTEQGFPAPAGVCAVGSSLFCLIAWALLCLTTWVGHLSFGTVGSWWVMLAPAAAAMVGLVLGSVWARAWTEAPASSSGAIVERPNSGWCWQDQGAESATSASA